MNMRQIDLGDDHQDQLDRRRTAAARLGDPSGPVAARIESAPAAYVLAHNSSDVARQCELLSTLPAPGEVRLVVTPGRAATEWHLDVASRDRQGLLAAFTGVLVRWGVDVVQAVLATWDDGGALQAFVINAMTPPEPGALQAALESSLEEPLWCPPTADADITFRNDASALYTCCEVRAVDRPGLLHALAVAIASAGANVHAARVTTVDGVALDRFDLSDRFGHRLDPALEETIRNGIHCGVRSRRARIWPFGSGSARR